jgi:sterol desaturase/sphingolipid hydroxylase (fatty acid hydroxylase superfamily)
MISIKSLWIFISLNAFLCSFSYIEYKLDNHHLLNNIISIVFKNYFFINFIDHILKNVDYINNDSRIIPVEKFYHEFDLFVLTTSIFEASSNMIIKKYMIQNNSNILYDLIIFIPYSFLFEILYDLFHYLGHRLSHSKYLYKYFHKFHHTYPYPITILTFYQHPVDLFLLNSIPMFLSFYLLNTIFLKPSLYMFKIITTFKTFIEISGHSGKNPNGSSFIQFFWLPKIFGFELKTKDHDLHHTLNNCNYSKRFSLWDNFFKTYK